MPIHPELENPFLDVPPENPFQAIPPENPFQGVSSENPFRGIPLEDPSLSEARDVGRTLRPPLTDVVEPDKDVADSLERASHSVHGEALSEALKKLGGGGSMFHLAANLVSVIDQGKQLYSKALGLEIGPNEYMAKAETYLRDLARRNVPEYRAEDLLGMIREGLLEAPAVIAEYVAGGKLLKTASKGMAAVEALREADKGPAAAAGGAVKGGLLGKALEATAPLRLAERAGGLSVLGGGPPLIQGVVEGDVKGRVKEAVTGATVMGALALPGGGSLRARDLYAKPTPEKIEPLLKEGRVAEATEAAEPVKVEPAKPATEATPASELIVGERVRIESPDGPKDGVITEVGTFPSPGDAKAPFIKLRLDQGDLAQGWVSQLRPTRLRSITEATPAGEQAVIPGAERISDKALAERQAQGRIAPEVPQQAADEGLFDVAGRGQGDLVDLSRERAKRQAAPGTRVIEIEGREVEVMFPDDLHAELYDYATALRRSVEGSTEELGQKASDLFQDFKPWVVEDFKGPGDVNDLAQDYLEGIEGDAAHASSRGTRQFTAHLVVDVDLQQTYARGERVERQGPAKRAKKQPTRTTLTDWLKSQGGLKEYRGELKAMGITPKARPGLVNNKRGMNLDDAAHAAWEAGFFPEFRERPGLDDFLEVLSDDFNRRPVRYQEEDILPSAEAEWEAQVTEWADRFGITIGNRPMEEIAEEVNRQAAAGDYAMPEVVLPSRPSMAPGTRYVGLIKDTSTERPGAVPEGPPITREQVLGPLQRALNIPVYSGQMGRRKVSGFFRKHVEEVRVKKRSDLEVTAHELAHLLDDRLPEIRKQWHPARKANKTIRDELRGVSYDKKKLYEGFAEFVRLWSTQKVKAQEAAPEFNAWFESFVERNEYGPALRQAQTDMHAWLAQDATLRARSKIGPQELINETFGRRRDRFVQSALDDLYGIYLAEKSLTDEIAKGGMYETARLTRGVSGILEAAAKWGAPKWAKDGAIEIVDAKGRPNWLPGKTLLRGRPKLKDNPAYRRWGFGPLLRPVAKDLDGFGLYAIGRRARYLKDQGRENLFTGAEIDAMLKLETPERKKAFADWNKYNKQFLDFAQDAGVIDPVGRKRWETNVYLPFNRTDRMKPSGGTGTPGSLQLIYRLRGGTANLGNPIENMFHNIRMLTEAAITNQARVQVIDGIRQAKGGARFLVKIPKTDQRVAVDREQVIREMRDRLEPKDDLAGC